MHTWNLYLHQDDFYFDRRKKLNADLSPSNKHNLYKIQNAKKEKWTKVIMIILRYA